MAGRIATLDLRDGNGEPLSFNDNWTDDPAQAAELTAPGIAPPNERDSIYGPWEKTFTLVQWDQRGGGKTYGRNPATDAGSPAARAAVKVRQLMAFGGASTDCELHPAVGSTLVSPCFDLKGGAG